MKQSRPNSPLSFHGPNTVFRSGPSVLLAVLLAGNLLCVGLTGSSSASAVATHLPAFALNEETDEKTQDKGEARTLVLGQVIERELAGDQAHSYSIVLSAGQYLHLVVEQRGIDVVVTLFGADGKKLAEVDSPNGTQGPEPVSVIAETAGGYRLEVRSLEKTAPAGRYEVKVEELRTATWQDKNRITAERVFVQADLLRGQGTAESLRSAIKKYEESLPLFRAIGDRSLEAVTLHNIGSIYDDLGEKQRALDYLTQALPLRRAVGDRSGEAMTLNNLGAVYDDLGEKQKALDSYAQALPLFRAVGNGSSEAAVLTNIGSVYVNLGEIQKALDHHSQALLLYRAVGDSRGEATTLSNIGAVYASLGEQRKALDYYAQALPLYRAVGDQSGEAGTLHNMGVAYKTLGKEQKALDYYAQALPLFRAIGHRRGEGTTLGTMGSAYAALGENQRALDYFAQALTLKRAVGDRGGEAVMLNNIGVTYKSLGDEEKAFDHFTQALPLYRAVGNRSFEALTLFNLASLKRGRRDLKESLTNVEAALTIVESLRTKIGSQELRSSYFATVQKYYELYIDLLMRMHELNPQEGHSARALEANERARARSLLELLIEARADIRQGVDAALLAREQELQKQLSTRTEARIRLLNGRHSAGQEQAATAEIEALTTKYQEVEAQIRVTSPRYAALVQPRPLTLREIQTKVLDKETLLLEYALGSERSFLWVVSHDDVAIHVLPKRAIIEDAARNFYNLLMKPASGAAKAKSTTTATRGVSLSAATDHTGIATTLSQMLLAPAAAQLAGKRLVIVADGAVQYIPFAALPEPASQTATTTTPSSGISYQPLIVKHEVVSLPSASTLAVLRNESAGRDPAPKTVAVLADPVFEPTDLRVKERSGREAKRDQPAATSSKSDPALRSLVEALKGAGFRGGAIPRLPYSRREALSIVSLVPEARRKLVLDFDANHTTATSAELSQYRFLHFATHGLLDSTHPELSGVLLSLVDEQGRPQAQGLLRLGEIYNLKLPVELIVLSSCQTALGQEVRGEGLVGLTRGFMYAGSPRVVASLWSVDDKGTADLMKIFYEGMLGPQKLPAAAALREAQKQMWQKNKERSPFYWAAFVLQGEWR